jgi:hypothetical protein
MIWFLTAIEVLHQGEGPSHYGETPILKSKSKRCFGYFLNEKDARRAIELNSGDMHECLYEYLVLELMEPGIHPHVHRDSWYRWCDETRGWIPSVKPNDFIGVINWGIG